MYSQSATPIAVTAMAVKPVDRMARRISRPLTPSGPAISSRKLSTLGVRSERLNASPRTSALNWRRLIPGVRLTFRPS